MTCWHICCVHFFVVGRSLLSALSHVRCFWIQDGRSEHERQYLFCQSADASENSELVKTPKWVLTNADWMYLISPSVSRFKFWSFLVVCWHSHLSICVGTFGPLESHTQPVIRHLGVIFPQWVTHAHCNLAGLLWLAPPYSCEHICTHVKAPDVVRSDGSGCRLLQTHRNCMWRSIFSGCL